MSIKLQQLKHFVMVVEEGGFRAASHRANRSQAAHWTFRKMGSFSLQVGWRATWTLIPWPRDWCTSMPPNQPLQGEADSCRAASR